MKNYVSIIKVWAAFLFVFILLCSQKPVFAIKNINDLSKAYGFYMGQQISLKICAQKWPSVCPLD